MSDCTGIWAILPLLELFITTQVRVLVRSSWLCQSHVLQGAPLPREGLLNLTQCVNGLYTGTQHCSKMNYVIYFHCQWCKCSLCRWGDRWVGKYTSSLRLLPSIFSRIIATATKVPPRSFTRRFIRSTSVFRIRVKKPLEVSFPTLSALPHYLQHYNKQFGGRRSPDYMAASPWSGEADEAERFLRVSLFMIVTCLIFLRGRRYIKWPTVFCCRDRTLNLLVFF